MSGAHFAHTREETNARDTGCFLGLHLLFALLALAGGSTCFLFLWYRRAARLAAYALVASGGSVLLWRWLAQAKDRDDCSQRAYAAFPVVFVCLGLLYATFFAPVTAPDEGYHYGMSYAYANALLPGAQQGYMRIEDYAFTRDKDRYTTTMTVDFWRSMQGGVDFFATHDDADVKVDNRKVLPVLNLQSNPPQLKLVSALAIACARLLNLSGVVTFYLGRIANFLLAALLVILAVRVAPVGKGLFITAALLPMSLHLFASYSYDSTIIALSFLLIALLLRVMAGEQKPGGKHLAASLAVGMLLAPCKVIYVLICSLALFVPSTRFSSRAQELAWKGSMLVVPALVIVGLRFAQLLAQIGVSAQGSGAQRERLGEFGQFYTAGDVVRHPLTTLLVVLRTNYENLSDYTLMLVGTWLGWFQGQLSMTVFQAFGMLFALACATAPSEDDDFVCAGRLRFALLAASLLMFAGIEFSMFTGWTFNTELTIQGVQGRYFLPFLPLVLLGLRSRAVELHTHTVPLLLLFMGSLDAFLLVQFTFNVLGGFAV